MTNRFISGLLALGMLGPNALAQNTIAIPSVASCRSCYLAVERIGTLGGSSSIFFGADFNDLFSLAASSKELLAGPLLGGGFGRFDFSGRLIARSPSFSPNERGYDAIGQLRSGVGDSVLLFNDMDWVVATVSAASGEGRRFRVPGFADDILHLPDGRVLANIVSLTPELAGFPLFLFSSNGSESHQFGATDRTLSSDHTNKVRRRLAEARGGGFWVAHRDRYSIEQWSSKAVQVKVLTRDVEWFPVGTVDQTMPPDEGKPGPRIEGMSEDARGRLWVVISVADAAWRATYRTDPRSTKERREVAPLFCTA